MSLYWTLKYGFIALLVFGTLSVALSWLVHRHLGFWGKTYLVFISVCFLVLADAVVIEPNWIEVKTVRIQDTALAAVLGDTRVVHISDIHLDFGIDFRERELIRKVNALKPDYLFITGDFIDYAGQVPAALELIRRFQVGLGIYGVPGNTDHLVMGAPSIAEALRPAGIDILLDENRRLTLRNGKILWLAGVDNAVYHPGAIEKTLAGIPDGAPVVLLAHSPEIFEQAAGEGIPLVLAGDTHGGQIGIPFLVRLSDYANRTPYLSGLFKKGKTKMYVNRGIGTKTLPVRFLCRPEITVIEVTP